MPKTVQNTDDNRKSCRQNNEHNLKQKLITQPRTRICQQWSESFAPRPSWDKSDHWSQLMLSMSIASASRWRPRLNPVRLLKVAQLWPARNRISDKGLTDFQRPAAKLVQSFQPAYDLLMTSTLNYSKRPWLLSHQPCIAFIRTIFLPSCILRYSSRYHHSIKMIVKKRPFIWKGAINTTVFRYVSYAGITQIRCGRLHFLLRLYTDSHI